MVKTKSMMSINQLKISKQSQIMMLSSINEKINEQNAQNQKGCHQSMKQ